MFKSLTIEEIASFTAFGVTAFFSCYTAGKILPTTANELWWIVAMPLGLIVNTAEWVALKKIIKITAIKNEISQNKEANLNVKAIDLIDNKISKLNRRIGFSIFFLVVMSSLSIFGTIRAFQMGYNRGEKIAEINKLKKDLLDQSDKIINGYTKNSDESIRQAQSKRRWSNMYLTKSNNNLKNAENLLTKKTNTLSEIASSIEDEAGHALYVGYATLFGGKVKSWAIFFNIIFGLIIELAMLYLNYENQLSKYESYYGIDQIKFFVNTHGKLIKKPNTNDINIIKDETPKPVSRNVSKYPKNDKTETIIKKTKIVNGNVNGNDSKKIFNLNSARFKKGKYDDLIWETWNNWDAVSTEQKSYGNVAKVVSNYLPGNKKISKTRVYRVINERNNNNQK